MNFNLYHLKQFLIFLFTLSCCVQSMAQYDAQYLKWKAKQEQADASLKGDQANYYLSKPSLNKTSSVSKTNSQSKSTSKIKLNSATLLDLQQLDGVGEKKAINIIEYRQQNGGFKSIQDLKNVKGIGPKLFEKNQSRLSL